MNIEALETLAHSFGLDQMRQVSGSFRDEHGQPAVAFECAAARYIHLFEVFRIEDKLSEIAGISILLFPSFAEVTAGAQKKSTK
jgi:hypothetical protein